MTNTILQTAKEKMVKTEAALQRELGMIRAGRANAGLLDRISVVYYGAPTPLKQLAQISVPEPRVLMITPFDKTSIPDIEKSIMQSDIGINPANDGNVIRLVIPQLTEERRKEMAKKVGKESENAKVSVRNIRREAIEELKKAEKNNEITQDDLRTLEEDIQKITNESVKNLDVIATEKEKELLDV
ncbi:ribosome recycling factor [Carnobacterium alterfunditum]|uniref:Ribosome-recycling factor n=1 Tax=Carnobacterium alterfunditum TaxID=28230 RepID=A0A1N6GXS9_9LACT|nr:ribosome recycling factor [Carnobacterium alterfunditum]SIO12296.1 ribosome recycling factor [Carnobacterium alterfunditum]